MISIFFVVVVVVVVAILIVPFSPCFHPGNGAIV
jgi:hypothetical protein